MVDKKNNTFRWNNGNGKAYKHAWYLRNKKRLVERAKERYKTLPDVRKKKLENGRKHPERRLIYGRAYRFKNKVKIQQYMKVYMRERAKKDIDFRLKRVLRTRIWKAVKGEYKKVSALKELGCSVEQLRFYLEGKFQEGMSWENYGEWHIDHIVPLAFFDFEDEVQVKVACHYKNLQPLWAADNLLKRDKIIDYATR